MGNQKEIFNLYEWLPGYGENNVSFRSDKGDVVLTITYDAVDPTQGEYASREFIFKSVCSFEVSAFPGIIKPDTEVENFSKESEGKLSLGSLNEYTDSKIADMWTRHFETLEPVRHLQVFFLAENKRFEIFAREVILSEPTYFNE